MLALGTLTGAPKKTSLFPNFKMLLNGQACPVFFTVCSTSTHDYDKDRKTIDRHFHLKTFEPRHVQHVPRINIKHLTFDITRMRDNRQHDDSMTFGQFCQMTFEIFL